MFQHKKRFEIILKYILQKNVSLISKQISFEIFLKKKFEKKNMSFSKYFLLNIFQI